MMRRYATCGYQGQPLRSVGMQVRGDTMVGKGANGTEVPNVVNVGVRFAQLASIRRECGGPGSDDWGLVPDWARIVRNWR